MVDFHRIGADFVVISCPPFFMQDKEKGTATRSAVPHHSATAKMTGFWNFLYLGWIWALTARLFVAYATQNSASSSLRDLRCVRDGWCILHRHDLAAVELSAGESDAQVK